MRYIVMATYHKSVKPGKYLITALNRKDAKERFLETFSWLNIISEIREATEEEIKAYMEGRL